MEINSDSRGVIVAPAGHGKTHLIGTRVATAGAHERLLVLTHTNIAVRAVRRRLPPRRAAHVRVETIDAMSFRIASSFPSAAGLSCIPIAPQAIDWPAIREGARRALNVRAIRHAFTSSYSGLIVDEFQDCSRIQLDLILTISQDMPTVVLGDPLQALYEFDAGRIDWQERTSGHEILGTLDTPWRWSSSNAMASWLRACRARLLLSRAIQAGPSTPAEILHLDRPVTQGALPSTLKHLKAPVAIISGESKITLRISHIARGNRWGGCEVFETAFPNELLPLVATHSSGAPPAAQALALLGFAKSCISRLSEITGFASAEKNLTTKGSTGRSRAPIALALQEFVEAPSGTTARRVLETLDNDSATYTYRPQLVGITRRAYTQVEDDDLVGFADALESVVETRKYLDEAPKGPAVGTSLRLKGLEFESVIIVDPHKFSTAEQLYVAITRPKSRVVIAIEPGQALGPWFY